MANLLGNTSFSDTGFLRLPIGTSAQRAGTVGAMRLNSTTGLMETFDGVAWDSNVVAFQYRTIITTEFPFLIQKLLTRHS